MDDATGNGIAQAVGTALGHLHVICIQHSKAILEITTALSADQGLSDETRVRLGKAASHVGLAIEAMKEATGGRVDVDEIIKNA